MSGDARDDLYQVAALLDELERALNPLAIDERGELVSTPSVPPALPQAPRGGGAGNASRGSSSPGPGQSRRSFDAEPRVERVRAQPTGPVHEQASRVPAPRRAPSPPDAPRAAASVPVASSEEVVAGAAAPERATSDSMSRALEVVRPPELPVRGAVRAPPERTEPVVVAPAAAHGGSEERARPVVRGNDDIAPAIPRARISTSTPPARDATPVVAVADPEPQRAARRDAPAAPERRSHARAKPPNAASIDRALDRADAPVLPGQRAAIRRSPASPAHRRSGVPLRKAETRATERARRVSRTGGPTADRAYEIQSPNHTAPPLPRRARERISEPPRVSMPPPEAVDPFERATIFDDELDSELDDAIPTAPPSTIWLRGGRMRWTAGPAQLARADRTLSRLVRKRGRRL